MSLKTLPQNKGIVTTETYIILAIVVLIILIATVYRPVGYTRYSTWTTQQKSYQSNPLPSPISNSKPVITLYGDNPYLIFHPGTIPVCDPVDSCPPRTDVYKEPGYKATDKEDGDITSRVIITDELPDAMTQTINPCHKWNKKYTVTDSNGNQTVARRVINECSGA